MGRGERKFTFEKSREEAELILREYEAGMNNRQHYHRKKASCGRMEAGE